MFSDILYKQKDVMTMGFPLGPTVTNVFLSFKELKWLEHCSSEFKPVLYRKYVDDTFVLFDYLQNLCVYLSKYRTSIFFFSIAGRRW